MISLPKKVLFYHPKIPFLPQNSITFNPQKSTFLYKTSQELRMLSRSLSDCQSLTLNVMIQVSQFVSDSQMCH